MTTITLSATALNKLIQEARDDEREACARAVDMLWTDRMFTAADAGVVGATQRACAEVIRARAARPGPV